MKLKPCPFCGSININVIRYGSCGNYYCECGDCTAIAPDPSQTDYDITEAQKIWNRRASIKGN